MNRGLFLVLLSVFLFGCSKQSAQDRASGLLPVETATETTVSPTRFADDPETIILWPDGAPGAVGDEDVDIPTLTLYLPQSENVTGTGVVVCPGGAYVNLAMDHEGQQIAEWLNSKGLAAFVLKYRLGPRYQHPSMIMDAQRAIRYVRSKADALGIVPDRIGIWGFSAGGHLASTSATHFDSGDVNANDPVERVGSRPDFLILSYPVITMEQEYTHAYSRTMLLGEDPDPDLVTYLSNEKQVTADTPPTFLFHTNEDTGVPAENSVFLYLALRRAGVPAEMHIYETGEHGVGLAPSDPVLSTWPDRLAGWLTIRGLMSR